MEWKGQPRNNYYFCVLQWFWSGWRRRSKNESWRRWMWDGEQAAIGEMCIKPLDLSFIFLIVHFLIYLEFMMLIWKCKIANVFNSVLVRQRVTSRECWECQWGRPKKVRGGRRAEKVSRGSWFRDNGIPELYKNYRKIHIEKEMVAATHNSLKAVTPWSSAFMSNHDVAVSLVTRFFSLNRFQKKNKKIEFISKWVKNSKYIF